MYPDIVYLFGGLIFVLILATALGQALARRESEAQQGALPSTIQNLNQRVNAWWVMVIVLAIAFAIGKAGVIILFALLSSAALREFMTLTYTRRGDHWALLTAFFVFLPAQYILIWNDWYGLYSILIPVYAFLFLPVIAALRGESTRFMERIAETQWGLMTAVYCLAYVPALTTLTIPGYEGRNLLLVAFLLLVVQASDVLQYIFGKLFGRHKIAPSLSPSKTVEGFIGGVASATLLGAALWWITPFEIWQAACMAAIISLMGFLGGLVMSAIKRDRDVKDWGWLIEGHGGILDRCDSIIFSAPIFFHIVRYWWSV